MEGERELTSGCYRRTPIFRLIVSDTIGVKEIERLVPKIQLEVCVANEQRFQAFHTLKQECGALRGRSDIQNFRDECHGFLALLARWRRTALVTQALRTHHASPWVR